MTINHRLSAVLGLVAAVTVSGCGGGSGGDRSTPVGDMPTVDQRLKQADVEAGRRNEWGRVKAAEKSRYVARAPST